jgi:hypothetical protein
VPALASAASVSQELHLLRQIDEPLHSATPGSGLPIPAPIRLAFAPRWLDCDAANPEQVGVLLEPVLDQRKQLRLLALFPAKSAPVINGEPGLHFALLTPGDVFRWAEGAPYRLVLFNKPSIGAPPEAALGKPCPVCRVPFAASTTTVACQCGAVIHCEPDGPDALQCAQMSGTCPVCRRRLVLTQGYAAGFEDE